MNPGSIYYRQNPETGTCQSLPSHASNPALYKSEKETQGYGCSLVKKKAEKPIWGLFCAFPEGSKPEIKETIYSDLDSCQKDQLVP